MPFGHWKNWNACMEDMQGQGGYDEGTAEKVCGKLKAKFEKSEQTKDQPHPRLDISPDPKMKPRRAQRGYFDHHGMPNPIRGFEKGWQDFVADRDKKKIPDKILQDKDTRLPKKFREGIIQVAKAVSVLGGKVLTSDQSKRNTWLYTNWPTKARREFENVREEERKKVFGKGELNSDGDYPKWNNGQFYKACPLCEGKKVEAEHAKTLESVGVPKEKIKEAEKKIAEDHIAEKPDYYEKLKEVEKDEFSRNNLLHNFKIKVRDVIDPKPKPDKEDWERSPSAIHKADTRQTDTDETDEKEIKNLRLKSKLSPGLTDIKEIREELTKDAKKEWDLNLDEMLNSERAFTGTFHKPVIDKENDIIPASAMDKAMDDFMVLPMLQEVHTERPVGIILKAWRTSEDEYKFDGRIKPGDDCDDVWNKIKKGEYDGLSIGGRRIRYSHDCSIPSSIRTTPCVTHKLKLYNVSVCSSPVNPEATVDAVAKADDTLVFDLTETLIKAESAENNVIQKGEEMPETDVTAVSKGDDELITKSDIAGLIKAVETLNKSFEQYFSSLTTEQPQHIDGKGHSVEDTMQKDEDPDPDPDEDPKRMRKAYDEQEDEIENIRKSFNEVIAERDERIIKMEETIAKMEETVIKKGGQAVVIPDQLDKDDPFISSNMALIAGAGRVQK